ncbi:MAG: enoyl-CoA hydratase-related protein [Paracoccaceae bacterium]
MNSMIETAMVITQLDQGVLTLTLGAGKAHPLSLAMIRGLHAEIDAAAQDDAVKVLVIYGPGPIFCAGHDLKEIARHRGDADDGRAYLTELFAACGAMMQALSNCAKPSIAMVEGIATAGGLQLAAACDLVFAARGATFCLPGVNNGGFCTTPAVTVSRVIGRKRVAEMALSGETFDAQWAREAGLVNRVLSRDILAREVMEFAHQLASRHAPAVADGKAALYRHLDMPLSEAYDMAADVMVGHFMDPHRIAHDKKNWLKS